MARLLWEHEGQVIKEYSFPRGSVSIGRRKENTIVFSNPEVSSSHARIDKVGSDYILTDLQSTNGTFVNGLKVLSHRLSHGDRISIGKNILLFIGTEKAKVEAERAKIPLDQTVIIGGSRDRKRAPISRVKVEKHYDKPTSNRIYLRVFLFGFLVVGALVALGVFVVKDKAFFLRGIIPSANQGQKSEGTPMAPSAEEGKTSQQDDSSLSASSGSQKSPALNEEHLEGGDTESASFGIEAIVWSSDEKKSFVLINGAEHRVGDLIEGKTIARIERDHIVLQSQEGESIIRLKFR